MTKSTIYKARLKILAAFLVAAAVTIFLSLLYSYYLYQNIRQLFKGVIAVSRGNYKKPIITMGAEETKKVQDNESKADKFVRLGEYRVNKVIDAIGRLENLSNRTNYEYTQEQVEAMFSIMEKRLLEVKGRFAPKKEKEDTFSFGRKAE